MTGWPRTLNGLFSVVPAIGFYPPRGGKLHCGERSHDLGRQPKAILKQCIAFQYMQQWGQVHQKNSKGMRRATALSR
jgi:hypothetical protein